MPKADLPRELPSWWIGNDGSDIVMPKFRLDRNWTPTGKQVEEMIYIKLVSARLEARRYVELFLYTASTRVPPGD